MIRVFSIRFRIALWYFLSAAPIVVALAVLSWYAMRASMYQGIDEELFRRTLGMEQFIQVRGETAIPELKQEAANGPDLPHAGGLFQIFDAQGKLLFQSPAIERHKLTTLTSPGSWERPTYRDSATRGDRVRLGSRRIAVKGRILIIVVAEPLWSFDQSLADYAKVLAICVPVLLSMLAGAGYWLSGRAIAPVEQINREARAIGADNLTSRLSVPKPRDELRTLSETLNAMLERIEGSVNRLTQFTADASHELRAPLTLIQTAAEYTLRRERSREELLEALNKILREVNRTAALVDRLLELARADSGKNQLLPVPVDLVAVLQEIAAGARPLARKRKIHFATEIGEAQTAVLGDYSALRELFLILVDNAVKYTQEKGSICLRLTARENVAIVEVVDTGIGIAAGDHPLIFDRFWRADKVRSREIGGTGLGLSIAKWIVEQHRGSIAVESEPGRGSKFSVRLNLFHNGASFENQP